MNKIGRNGILIGIMGLLLFNVATVLAQEETEVFEETEEALDQEPVLPEEPSWAPLLEEAKALEGEENSYLEAQKIYESLLEGEALGEKENEVREAYEALNMKILLSSSETPDSLIHTVVSGDNLYNIAKKYKTTVELIQRSNKIEGDKIYPDMKLKITKAQFSIEVEKFTNRLTLLADNKPLKSYKIATGANDATPGGTFKIVNKLKDPTWFHAGVILPPDSPDNILGSRWLGFDKAGYGIHGTTLPETIGTHASKGCIRMLNTDAEEIYDIVPLGTQVIVKE